MRREHGMGRGAQQAQVKPGAPSPCSVWARLVWRALRPRSGSGQRVIAVDTNDEKEAVAREFGATDFVPTHQV